MGRSSCFIVSSPLVLESLFSLSRFIFLSTIYETHSVHLKGKKPISLRVQRIRSTTHTSVQFPGKHCRAWLTGATQTKSIDSRSLWSRYCWILISDHDARSHQAINPLEFNGYYQPGSAKSGLWRRAVGTTATCNSVSSCHEARKPEHCKETGYIDIKPRSPSEAQASQRQSHDPFRASFAGVGSASASNTVPYDHPDAARHGPKWKPTEQRQISGES